jgi:hypothetical protein
VAYNFQSGKNRTKLLTVYESVIQKVLLIIESILENAKYNFLSYTFMFCNQFYVLFPV